MDGENRMESGIIFKVETAPGQFENLDLVDMTKEEREVALDRFDKTELIKTIGTLSDLLYDSGTRFIQIESELPDVTKEVWQCESCGETFWFGDSDIEEFVRTCPSCGKHVTEYCRLTDDESSGDD